MAQVQKADFVFRRNGRAYLNRRGASVQSNTGRLAVHISLFTAVQACVLQSCDAYWLPTPFSCFPFTSPLVRHRVPSHFNWTLQLRSFICANTSTFVKRNDTTVFHSCTMHLDTIKVLLPTDAQNNLCTRILKFTMQGFILPTLSRISFAVGDGRYWNNRHAHPI